MVCSNPTGQRGQGEPAHTGSNWLPPPTPTDLGSDKNRPFIPRGCPPCSLGHDRFSGGRAGETINRNTPPQCAACESAWLIENGVGNRWVFRHTGRQVNPTVRWTLPRLTSRLLDPRSLVSSSVRHPLWFVVAPPRWLGASLCAKALPVHQYISRKTRKTTIYLHFTTQNRYQDGRAAAN